MYQSSLELHLACPSYTTKAVVCPPPQPQSDNVLLWEDGQAFVSKTLVWHVGLDHEMEKSGAGAGTLAYKSPEAFDNEFTIVYGGERGLFFWHCRMGGSVWQGAMGRLL